MEKNNNNNKINRRDFFKLAGAGTLASATALYGLLRPKEQFGQRIGRIRRDTYRQNGLPHQPYNRRPRIHTGLRLHALAHPETGRRKRR